MNTLPVIHQRVGCEYEEHGRGTEKARRQATDTGKPGRRNVEKSSGSFGHDSHRYSSRIYFCKDWNVKENEKWNRS